MTFCALLATAQVAQCASPLTHKKIMLSGDIAPGTGGGRFYVSTGASADVAHTWRKVTFTSNASYTTDRYPVAETVGAQTGNRRDDTYSAGVGAAYQMRSWLSLDASYQRAQRFSFFLDQFDYAADRYGIGLNVQF